MRSACLERTRFILNNFSGIGLGVPGPPLATPLLNTFKRIHLFANVNVADFQLTMSILFISSHTCIDVHVENVCSKTIKHRPTRFHI